MANLQNFEWINIFYQQKGTLILMYFSCLIHTLRFLVELGKNKVSHIVMSTRELSNENFFSKYVLWHLDKLLYLSHYRLYLFEYKKPQKTIKKFIKHLKQNGYDKLKKKFEIFKFEYQTGVSILWILVKKVKWCSLATGERIHEDEK